LTAGALLLTSCADDPDDSADEDNEPTEEPEDDPDENEPELTTGSDLVPNIDPTVNGKGVTDDEIKVVYNLTLEACGNDPATAAAYVVTDQYQETIDVLVDWFNENVEFPGGRTLSLEYVNDGGPNAGCEDVAREAGLRTANEIEAFAALGNSTNFGGASVYAETTTSNGTIQIGGATFQTAQDLTDRWPYAFNIYQIAEASLEQLAWYIGKRETDTMYVAPDGTESPRVWGALFFDDDQGHKLSDSVIANLAERGVEATPYFVSGDAAQAGQEATALAAQMREAGVNSVVYGAHGVPGSAVALAFDAQEYFPDHFISDFGAFTGLALFNSALYGLQTERFRGVGTPGPAALRIDINLDGTPTTSTELTGTGQTLAEIAYHAAGGPLPTPTVGAPLGGFWDELSTLAIGVVNAGETLNAFTFAQGLEEASTCQIERFFFRDQEQSPLRGYSQEEPWGYHGFTPIYWTTELNTIESPGYFESYDGYTRFMTEDDLPDEPSYDTGEAGDYPTDGALDGPKGDLAVACS
jgi:hypothetical protein